MEKIDKQIVKASVKNLENSLEKVSETNSKNFLKLPREEILTGSTYKIQIPTVDHSIYMVINNQNGVPFEVFLQSKNKELFEFLRVTSITLSAFLRTGLDIHFLIEEYKEIYEPAGGFRTKLKFIDSKSRYYPSLIALIAVVLEHHINLQKPQKEIL